MGMANKSVLLHQNVKTKTGWKYQEVIDDLLGALGCELAALFLDWRNQILTGNLIEVRSALRCFVDEPMGFEYPEGGR